jgi:hypothetical protein
MMNFRHSSTFKGMKMSMLNIVSLPKYIDEIIVLVAHQYFYILALNETRLDDNISNQDMFIHQRLIHRVESVI